MTVAEAGRRGGEKTARTHGHEYFEKIGRKGGNTVSAARGSEFYSEIGSRGGSERARQLEDIRAQRAKPSLRQMNIDTVKKSKSHIIAGKRRIAE